MRLKSRFVNLVASSVLALLSLSHVEAEAAVEIIRVPHGGIQPRMSIGPSGAVHLIYFSGDAKGGNLFYVKRSEGDKNWSKPVRVNLHANSAMAVGTIRGAQMALGQNERVHVAWMGSGAVAAPGKKEGEYPKHPMLYTRLSDKPFRFEAERNLLTWTAGLDGGGTVAADREGRVYVAWHGHPEGGESKETNRAVYVARSEDDGKSFSREIQANPQPTGACGCCGIRGFADSTGRLYLQYRMVNASNRDMGVLVSKDRGHTFILHKASEWRIQACPMSSSSFGIGKSGVVIAMESEGRVATRRIALPSDQIVLISGISDLAREGKHPSLAANQDGDIMLAWSEGAGWAKGGNLKWQVFDDKGEVMAGSTEAITSLPEWSFATTTTKPDGSFMLIY